MPAASMGRLNLLLAGPSHWARQVGVGLLIVLVVVLPLALLMAWLPPSKSGKDPMSAMRFGLCMGLFSVALNPLMQLSGALVARRREQGLLTLAPGVPQGAALRDAWSAYLVRQFFIGWGLCAAFALGLMLAFAGPGAAQFVAAFRRLPAFAGRGLAGLGPAARQRHRGPPQRANHGPAGARRRQPSGGLGRVPGGGAHGQPGRRGLVGGRAGAVGAFPTALARCAIPSGAPNLGPHAGGWLGAQAWRGGVHHAAGRSRTAAGRLGLASSMTRRRVSSD